MSSPVISENLFLLYSFGMGIFITFVYDIFRIWRRVLSHNRFFISLEDILFWIFSAISVFYLMHAQSNGTLRWFAVFGALIGMILYKKTISPFYVKWSSFLLNKIIKLFKKILQIVGKPFKLLGKRSRQAGKQAVSGSRRAAGMVKKRLTAFVKMLKITVSKR